MNRVLSKLHKPIMNNKLYIQKKLINTTTDNTDINNIYAASKISFVGGFILGTFVGGISGGGVGMVVGGTLLWGGLGIKRIFN